MATHLVKYARDSGELPAGPFADRENPSFLECIVAVFTVCARAQAAARHYEELARLSDQELALRGLKRADLPRMAFDFLVEGEVAAITRAGSQKG